MDESAEKLFQELGGIRIPAREKLSIQAAQGQSANLQERQDDFDRWRILLVELAYLLNASFQDVQYWEGVKAEKNTFGQLIRTLQKLDQMSIHDGTIRINLRGSQTGKISEKVDYVIKFGEVTLDLAGISALTRRMGLRFKHLEGRLLRSFVTFKAQGIKTLILKIPETSDNSIETLRISLRVISCYQQAVESNSPIVFTKGDKEVSFPPILDETNQPDPNLTLVAALNEFTSETMQALVQKVTKLIRDKNLSLPGGRPANVYQTMFKMKSLQQRLIKPPLEINSDKPAAAHMGTAATGATTGMPTPADHRASGISVDLQTDPALLKASVAQLVKDAFGDSSEKAGRIMKSVYGKDYQEIDSQRLEERLGLVSDLLLEMKKNPKGQQAMQEVLRRIQIRMDQVPSEVLDDLVALNGEIRFWSDRGETMVAKIDENLLGIIDNAKQRLSARKKNRAVLSPDQAFETDDFKTISSDFNISATEAEDIVRLFKSCFDDQGDFLRASFEKKIPDFVRYRRVFDILWEFLKGTSRRSDRLPFLNSLQLLVKEQKNPIAALKVLLSDFILDPTGIEFADRNAMILANQFLRTYNKELNMNIEITPEEVLLVKVGLNAKAANYAKWKVDGEQRRFFEKLITIRTKLLETLDSDSSDTRLLPTRFLLALEREVHIFLALTGGQTAYTVISGSLNVYGNPSSQVYRLKESQNLMSSLMQHLAVLIRGIGRIGENKDLFLLNNIKEREEEFISLGKDLRHGALVRRVLGWIDAAKNEINNRKN